ncbi:MAG: PepSY-like domain-containing protein [Bacteroidales bacterium]|nr:PepSY-like domain-containing protein [Bacteroidales bacterium]
MKQSIFTRFILFFTLLFMSLSVSYAQKDKLTPADIPDDVMQTLDYEYPGVKVLAWTLEENNFVATFKEDGLQTKAYFSNKGEWVKTLSTISKKEIPASITDYVANNYDNYLISAVYLQRKPNTKLHYLVEAHADAIGVKSSWLTFNDQGELMERFDPEPVAPKATSNQTAQKANVGTSSSEKKANDSAQKPEKAAKPEKTKKAEVKKEEEPIASSSIPPIVNKALTKKVQRPEDLKWYLRDTIYMAKCTTKAQANEIYITRSGIWQKTLIELAEEQVTGNMLKHIKEYYKGYKFANASKELRADKQDKFYVSIYEKANYKQKLKTTIIFDKTGKLIKTIEADVAMGGAEESKEDKSLDRYYAQLDKASGEGELKAKELPSDIRSYISMNYPSYIYKSCTLVSDNDFGEIYRIVVKADGISNMSETLYFSKTGKYLKKESGDDESETESSVETPAKTEIPEAVMTAFKTKYPRVISPEWSETDNDQYMVNFNGTKGKTICVFAANGTLLETHSSMNPENITPNIETYLKQNAKGSKVIEYYSVVKADKKKYYKVVIKPKKSTELETLWFNNAGKIVEE